MATTSIWRVKGWLGKVVIYVENPDKTENPAFYEKQEMTERQAQGLSDVIDYAVNSEKTQTADEAAEVMQQFVSGVNCHPATAREEMIAVKKRFGKEDGTVAYHGYQSFAPGEATPEMAHEIGVKLAQQLWGDKYQVIVATHLDKDSQFIMSLVEQIDKHGVGPQHKSIIDRCTALVYQEAEETGIIPTLCTLREKLMEQPEEKAKEIALSLELFTTGSLDIFGHGSNVDLDKRVVVFNIHDLGEQLKPTGLLVITDTMLNRVTLNWKRGKRTHVFIDEFHVVFENEYSGNFFNSAWRQFRKRNAYPTAITQNVEYLLDSVQASTMLSNSEFIVMLNQAASDREKLARLLNISNEQMSYVTNADAGCGLIKYGSALVPFVNRFPKDTQLYKLMTTKPGEGVFGGRGKEETA